MQLTCVQNIISSTFRSQITRRPPHHTIEPNGQLGYELMRHAKPVTIGELERMLGLMPPAGSATSSGNLFEEIQRQGHDHAMDPKLQ